MNIDYLRDLGFYNTKGGGSNTGEGVENVVIDYTIDSTSSPISIGNIVTFINNNIKKKDIGERPCGIALSSGIAGEIIKCQLLGVVNIPGFFIAGQNYFNTVSGELSTEVITPTTELKHIGFAITSSELLIKRGAFINEENV